MLRFVAYVLKFLGFTQQLNSKPPRAQFKNPFFALSFTKTVENASSNSHSPSANSKPRHCCATENSNSEMDWADTVCRSGVVRILILCHSTQFLTIIAKLGGNESKFSHLITISFLFAI